MSGTGETDRKRCHVSTISPTAAPNARKQALWPSSEDKKLDITVLRFQNQKLSQKLEAQKIEYSALESKVSQVKEKQKSYDSILKSVNNFWDMNLNHIEMNAAHMRVSSAGEDVKQIVNMDENTFLSSHRVTDATQSSSPEIICKKIQAVRQTSTEKIETASSSIIASIDDVWHLKDEYTSALKELPEDGSCRNIALSDIESEVKNLRSAFSNLYLKHKELSDELQSHRDSDAKEKSELKRLRGAMEIAVAELDESNNKLAVLKAESDATKGAFYPVLNLGSKHIANDRVRDKQKDLQDLKSALSELLDQASSRLLEIKGLHEERIKILKQLAELQNLTKNVKSISSSQPYILVRDQLEKSKSELLQYQASFEKLQAKKESLTWWERDLVLKFDLVDVSRSSSTVADSKISYLETEIQKQLDERKRIETILSEASSERGRKEIITEFKALISSFPKEMSIMQSQLSKYKEEARNIHLLRADVQSVSSILDRKAKLCETLSAKSVEQATRMHKLQAVVQDLKDTDNELKLILSMYKRESADSRDFVEARDLEFKAWAHVQSLKSSLEERDLETRVKVANEAEATSQQRLAAAEAEIADLRQKSDRSKRDMARLAGVLKSKNEENETYLSEIDTIGQAYDDMQTQNQHLLQQITERDDYNIKLALEGVKAKQLQGALIMDKHALNKEYQQSEASLNLFSMKASRIDDQLRFCSGQVQKLQEDRSHNSKALENTQKRVVDLTATSDQARESLERSQSKVERNRLTNAKLQMELDKERLNMKRKRELLEARKKKLSSLVAQTEGSSAVEKLQKELREYKEIHNCSICLERPKEVVITKCYHLFCNSCMQKVTESRHRKCPLCATSFGANDVKPVYI